MTRLIYVLSQHDYGMAENVVHDLLKFNPFLC